ncbi:MAG: cobalamin-dependent protein, partial [Neofamilia sp.]
MKILLIGINAKYSHQNLALHYIKQYSKVNTKVLEFNINQNIETIYGEILKEEADVIGFSSYIWNIEFIQRLSSDLKMANPNVKIIWGGPEVSFDTKELLEDNPAVDIIIRGEGEETSKELDLSKTYGISYRDGDKIFINPERELIKNLDDIPSPFFDMEIQKGKLLYYEMSRGCPFKCAYCLSSTIKGVRYFSEERIKSDLLKIMEFDVDTVKLVDRTFNSNEAFSIRIMEFINEHAPEGMCFLMELMAHMISVE